MKKIYLFSLSLIISLSIQAQDDVYDAPEPKRVVVYTESQQDESNYDPYDNYDYDYNGYNQQDLRYSNRLRRMYTPQSQIFINANPYSFYNPYATFGYNSFYDPWMSNSFYDPYGFNSFNNFYNPYCNFGFSSFYNPYAGFYNPYSIGFYRPFNNWNNWNGNWGNNWGNSWSGNWGNNNYRPRPQTPRRETPRGFSRSDDTYRPSPARTQPSTSNGGFGTVPSNSSRESNRYSSPSSAPLFPSNNNNGNNNQGGFGGSNNNSQPASTPTNGNNRGRTGRF